MGPKGTFWEHPELPKVRIRTWQIWNEPHFEDYWHTEGGELWASHYTLLLKERLQGRSSAPTRGATVVNTALASFPWRYLKQDLQGGRREVTWTWWRSTRSPSTRQRDSRRAPGAQGHEKAPPGPQVDLDHGGHLAPRPRDWRPAKTAPPGSASGRRTRRGMAERLRQVYDLVIQAPQARADRARVLVHVGFQVRGERPLQLLGPATAGTARASWPRRR